MIAAARGCSLPRSADAARSSTSRSVQPAWAVTVSTVGRPRVSVPVLSKTTVSVRPIASSASALRKRMPASAARPVPTMMAVGVARPMAHGQAITTTLMKAVRASVRCGSGPGTNQTTNVAPAMTRTSGTKTSLTRSARRWSGTFVPWARSTRSTIEARTVSRPTRVARITRVPDAFSVAPMTSSPGAFSTGAASPVSINSSTAEAPSTTIPSTGTRSPGRTRSRSPTRTTSSRTSTSCPSCRRRAVRGCSPMRRRIASLVWPLARASSQRPSSTSPTITVELSK